MLIRVSLALQANVEDIVAVDTKYLFSLLQPNASWGAQEPHEYVCRISVEPLWSFTCVLAPKQGFSS